MPADGRHGGRLRSRLSLLRALASRNVRDNDVAIVALGVAAAAVIATGVVLLQKAVALLHSVLFDLPRGAHLSAGVAIGPWQPLVVPVLGGLVLGLAGSFARRLRAKDIVDPIEANALYGGAMSLLDSLRLALSTLMSNAAGASVGMEAGYTQVGAGIASTAGQAVKLRRADLRILVGCGAAAAIAAAFNAPLAGAFYAFELVIGSYTLAALAPVSLSAITAGVITRWTSGSDTIFAVYDAVSVGPSDYPFFGLIGIGAAVLGIATMKAVTLAERLFRAAGIPGWLRPAVGGLLVGAIALLYPQVLGSGHGAIQHNIVLGYGVPVMAALLVAKVVASAISLGSGFRGGLFSSSLFLGSLYGSLFATVVGWLLPDVAIHQTAFILIGMGSVAAAIVGAPLTMVMLVQEATADFPATLGVLTSVAVATMIVRRLFGYSFATWRFHLRGLPIHGAHDVGWIESLTVGRLMRRDAKSVPATMSLAGLRRAFPLGSAKQVFVVDESGRFAGIVTLSDVHDPTLEESADQRTAGDFARSQDAVLFPGQNVRSALKLFTDTEEENLPVVESAANKRLLGYLTEAYALRRYNQELERKRAEELGERNLYR
ncbi:chloride channel protein [Azospirillum canadense]|uniref:chloride channel protein n=1 Tax=Azospirillum canadense TaxID=403962 RepID=UPI0022260809|nr:chloride channel protein [Azospirillum canadense]MCW2241979.1 CIC family chloride channel protein [Azospirillum canadense]